MMRALNSFLTVTEFDLTRNHGPLAEVRDEFVPGAAPPTWGRQTLQAAAQAAPVAGDDGVVRIVGRSPQVTETPSKRAA